MAKKQNIQKFITTLLGCICIYIMPAQSQEASINATLKQPQLLMGEQTQLAVQVNVPIDKPIAQWFNLPDTFNHLEVLQRSPLDSSITGNTKIYYQTFTITGFDSGLWVIPPLEIITGNKKITSAPLELIIVPAKLTGAAYNDIRDIIDVPVKNTPWWYWALIFLGIAVVLGLIWWWIKQKRIRPVVSRDRETVLPLLEEAMQKLRQLKAQHFPEKNEWKKYYTELTDVFKTFNEGKFQNGTLKKTTDEILITMSQYLSKEALGELAETLRIADAVKFAKYQPDITRSAMDIEIIEKNLKKLDTIK